jgi:putative FmdB family regulatory protein
VFPARWLPFPNRTCCDNPAALPIYEYKCENGHVFDAIQKFSDETLTECEVCGAPVVRVLTPPAIHFKGSGFHNTDYKKSGSGNGGKGDGSSSGDSSESSSSDSSTSDSGSSGSKSGDSGSSSGESSGSGDKAAASTTD